MPIGVGAGVGIGLGPAPVLPVPPIGLMLPGVPAGDVARGGVTGIEVVLGGGGVAAGVLVPSLAEPVAVGEPAASVGPGVTAVSAEFSPASLQPK